MGVFTLSRDCVDMPELEFLIHDSANPNLLTLPLERLEKAGNALTLTLIATCEHVTKPSSPHQMVVVSSAMDNYLYDDTLSLSITVLEGVYDVYPSLP